MVERTIISRPVLLHPWQFFEDLETFIPKIASIYLFWMSNLGFTTEKTKNLSTQHVNLRCPNCLVNLKVTSCLSLNGVFMPGRGTDGLHLFQKNNLRESNKTLVFFKSKNAISWWQLAVRVCVYNIYISIVLQSSIYDMWVTYILWTLSPNDTVHTICVSNPSLRSTKPGERYINWCDQLEECTVHH